MKNDRRQSDKLDAAEMQDIAQAVIDARMRANLSRREVADAMQTDYRSISRLESGKHLPSTRSLQRLARITGTRFRIAFDPLPPTHPTKASHMMTNTLTQPGISTDRRQFLGGAMGLAGLLGFGAVKQVTAEEATAAAEGIDAYIWTPPTYEPEPSLFTVIDRNEETATVKTIDGLIEVPANPQRIVSLCYEYVSLFELGISDRLVGIGDTGTPSHPLLGAGDRTAEMYATLKDIPLIPSPWEVDVEYVITLNPDLILSAPGYPEDPSALAQVAPVIRSVTYPGNAPRSALREFEALFGLGDVSVDLIAEHEAFIERARHAVAPAVAGKKAISVFPTYEDCWVQASYYVVDNEIFAHTYGSYQLHRELGITPSSFIEHLADEEDRQFAYISVAMEQVGLIDADYIFVEGADNYDAFVASPAVQQSVAGQLGQIYVNDYRSFGIGLAGVRASVAYMVECITGEPFE